MPSRGLNALMKEGALLYCDFGRGFYAVIYSKARDFQLLVKAYSYSLYNTWIRVLPTAWRVALSMFSMVSFTVCQ